MVDIMANQVEHTTRNNASIKGLTSEEVRAAQAAGKVNADATVKTRSYGSIFRSNICTLFNLINVILAVFVFLTGSYKNMLFMLVIVINTIIGIVQEIRSKITTDRLSIVVAANVEVMRDGKIQKIPIDELVLGDVMRLGRGNQIPTDSVVLKGECKTDESLLTGESRLIPKHAGDQLYSGSFINAGAVWARVEKVGADNYAAQITNEAKQKKAINSEIMTSLNKIIKYVSIFMFPVGLLLFANEYLLHHVELDPAILSTVSAMVSMIPEGLILLASTVMAVAVVRLARHQVLVQQLYCIETLARVDVLCLDKTGTITTGGMEVSGLVPLSTADSEPKEQELSKIVASLVASDEDPNDTARAVQEYFGLAKEGKQKAEQAITPADLLNPTRVIPFSSDTKWSGAAFANGEAYVMGAAQFVLEKNANTLAQIKDMLDTYAADARVLLVARVEGFDTNGTIEGEVTPLGFVCLRDQIRSTAAQTITYFKEQGVKLKVISGDDPHTVSGIAQKVGIEGADRFVDASTLKTDQDIASAIKNYNVFGRVRPEQKKAFVLALQAEGHTVAMTGDGVNDVLALKASDCSVAMASGSDAARNVAQLVLVDNDFASMPAVVAEGRRSINNLQRSASLFLVKTLLSITAAFLFIFLPWQYPFVPIQLTLISAFTIGLPSFVLALEPNKDLVRGHFLPNAVVHSIPGAVCAVVSIVVLTIVGNEAIGLDYRQVSTLCVMVVGLLGIMLVIRLSISFTPLRWGLLVVVIGGLLIGVVGFGWLFDIAPFTPEMWQSFGIAALVNIVAFNYLYNVLDARHQRRLASLTH